MEVNVKKLPGSKVEMTVSVPWDDWKGDVDTAVTELGKEMSVKGFRAGKVPREVVEKKLGKATVVLEGAERAVRRLYPAALTHAGIDGIGQPEIRLDAAEEGEALSFVATTAVIPEVSLGAWEKKVKKVNADYAGKKPEVNDEEIDAELRKLAESRAKFVTVDREAREGDMAEIDFTVTRDGVPIEGGTSKKHPIVLGKGVFIPGFEEELAGMKAGEEKIFELSFPGTYHVKELAGRPASFHVKVNLVQERQLPELTDGFAASLGSFENLAKLRESVSEGMLDERKKELEEKRRTEILEAVVSVAEAELPELLVDEEVRRMVSEFGNQASMMGMKLEDYLTRLGKTVEELGKEWRPQAEKRILSELSIARIADDREITPAREEVEEEMNRILAYAKSVEQAEKDFDLPAMYTLAQNRLRNQKLFEWLERM